jgi:hypothetical protein
VHLQHRPRLQRRRQCLYEHDHPRHLREGHARLHIRIGARDGVHQWRVQRGLMLHEYVHVRANRVRCERARGVHPGDQRLLGLRGLAGLRDGAKLRGSAGVGRVPMSLGRVLCGPSGLFSGQPANQLRAVMWRMPRLGRHVPSECNEPGGRLLRFDSQRLRQWRLRRLRSMPVAPSVSR